MKIIKSILKKFVKIKKEKILIPCLEGHFLENRCAFITGGSSGIGFSIAESFLKNGATVIITGRDQEKIEQAKVKLISNCKCDENRVFTGILDLTEINSLEKNVLSIVEKTNNKVDIFVNNAGTNGGKLFPNTSESDYDKVLDTNLKGMYFMSQVIVNYMINNHIKGNILNVTSSSALRPAISPYIVSKWGENGLTLGMAKKYLEYGIIVNGIAPGSTATTMIKSDDLNDLNCDYALTKRYIAPEEIGNIATVLVSDMGKMIVGDITGRAGIITYDDMKY